jgi:hypothetical protein
VRESDLLSPKAELVLTAATNDKNFFFAIERLKEEIVLFFAGDET